MNERVAIVIKALGMQKKAFAEAIGIEPASLSRILSGRSAVTQDLINQIVKKYHVTREWLETGYDYYPMFDNKETPAILQETKSNYNTTMNLKSIEIWLASLQQQVNELKEKVELLENPQKKKNHAG